MGVNSSRVRSIEIFIHPMFKSRSQLDYLGLWKNIFTNEGFSVECSNVLHILEIFLITSFTNSENRLEESPGSRKTRNANAC